MPPLRTAAASALLACAFAAPLARAQANDCAALPACAPAGVTLQTESIASPGADGRPVLSLALFDTDLARVRDGILKACDAVDGATDGLASNPAACRLDVRTLPYPGAKDTTGQSLSIFRLDFDRDPPRMDAHAWMFDTADDTKLAGVQGLRHAR